VSKLLCTSICVFTNQLLTVALVESKGQDEFNATRQW
jgi:hypothetical protein